jgi:aryl-alcohol dehydrogenase-like predicted oxidoreductase
MRTLLEEGRIGAVGVSNYSLERWRKADDALGSAVISNQVLFSLAQSGPLDRMVPFAEQQGRMVMAYSPLAQGLLSGKYTVENRPGGVRRTNPLFGTENLRRGAPLLDVLRQVATAHDAKPAQVALAWLLSFPPVVVIPGASSVEQLEFNVAASELELDPSSLAALTDAARAFAPLSAMGTLVSELRTKIHM